MKVVINIQHGGFGLSDAGVKAYALKKGIALYPENTRFGFTIYWTKPDGERGGILSGDEFYNATMDERQASNKAYDEATLSPREIPRYDPDLVSVIEDMGNEADGAHATLKVVEIPDGVQWEIEEYYGLEWVAEVHQTWS